MIITRRSNLTDNQFETLEEKQWTVPSTTLLSCECPIHGPYTQRADNYQNNHDCPRCASLNNIRKRWPEGSTKTYTPKVPFIPDSFISYMNYLGASRVGLDRWCKNTTEIIYADSRYYCSVGPNQERNDLNKRYFQTYQAKSDHPVVLIQDYQWCQRQSQVQDVLECRFMNYMDLWNARDFKVGRIDSYETDNFLYYTHIQGPSHKDIIRYGLYNRNLLVAVMTFSKARYSDIPGTYELRRFSTHSGAVVRGAASKLFYHFVKDYDPKAVIAYCDKNYFDGNMYTNLGFYHAYDTPPEFHFVEYKGDVCFGHGREGYKSTRIRSDTEFINKYNNNPESYLSDIEEAYCSDLGFYKICDCGNKCFIWRKE